MQCNKTRPIIKYTKFYMNGILEKGLIFVNLNNKKLEEAQFVVHKIDEYQNIRF